MILAALSRDLPPLSSSSGTISPQYAAESRIPAILAGSMVPFVVASVFVIARLVSRAFLLRTWGQDDSWISISWLAAFAMAVTDCSLTLYGSGKHMSLQTPAQLPPYQRRTYAAHILYNTALGTTKMGICAFYLRVWQDRASRLITFSIAAFIALSTTGLVLDDALQCAPGARAGGGARCAWVSPNLCVSAACNVLADVLLLWFVVWRIIPLRMPARQKTTLLLVVSLSVLVIAAAIIRVVRIVRLKNSMDLTWDSWDLSTWSSLETNMALFCLSAPALKPLVRKLWPNFLASSGAASATTTITITASYGSGVPRNTHHRTISEPEEIWRRNDLERWRGRREVEAWGWREAGDGDGGACESGGLARVPGELRTVKSANLSIATDGGDSSRGRLVEEFEHV